MRIHLKTSPNTEPVPFDYQQKLVGTIHKWIGVNSIHDKISLYSFSWLNGGKMINDAIQFPEGATWFISFYDENRIIEIIKSILSDNDMFCGMKVLDVTIEDKPRLSKRELFYCASPIFIKRTLDNGKTRQYNFNDVEANQLMKDTLLSKMDEAGIERDEALDIQFDISFMRKRLKLVHYHNVNNKASVCPVIIKAKETTKQFIWDVGLGNCTGIGFGAIK